MTGFARIITYDERFGILTFKEGHFRAGEQYDFGRFYNQMPNGNYYEFEQSYTGWFPESDEPGAGIAVVDTHTIHAGLWKAQKDFPNKGVDLLFPKNLQESQIYSLKNREISVNNVGPDETGFLSGKNPV